VRKKESLFLLEGEARLTVDGKLVDFKKGDCITINPGEKHRIEALTDVRIVEVSTPDLDDVVRHEDDYGR
jgi:mannose-6-phosphate isomerase-like protein (cupin superfamily)